MRIIQTRSISPGRNSRRTAVRNFITGLTNSIHRSAFSRFVPPTAQRYSRSTAPATASRAVPGCGIISFRNAAALSANPTCVLPERRCTGMLSHADTESRPWRLCTLLPGTPPTPHGLCAARGDNCIRAEIPQIPCCTRANAVRSKKSMPNITARRIRYPIFHSGFPRKHAITATMMRPANI